MNELEMLLQGIKSLKECTTTEMQGLYRRYDSMKASGSAENNEVYLHQQNIDFQVADGNLEKKELEAIFEEKGIKYDPAYEGRVKLYKASDETVDSAGDIIRQTGWDFSRYKTNPVFAYSHDYHDLPIGKGIKWFIKDGALWIYNMFALQEANPWADMCLNMVNAKMLNGNSVGFVPKKVLRVEDEGERSKLGLGRYGVIFEKQMLLEDSACTLGCNPSALVQDTLVVAMQKGIVSKDSMNRIMKDDSAIKLPESLRIAVDRAMVMVNRKLSVTAPEVPTEQTKTIPVDTVITGIEEIKTLLTTNNQLFTEIKTEIQSINTDMANIRKEIKSIGISGTAPEAETEVEKDLYDLIAGISGVTKTIENQLNKDNL